MSEPDQATRLPPALREFLAAPADGQPWPPAKPGADLAGRDLYVEEPLLGQPSSRFVKEGGVRLNRVTHYALTPDDLPPMFRRRPGLTQVKLVLLKFWLMFDELPPNREYLAIRIRVSLQPPAPVLLLRPDGTTSQAEPAQAPAQAASDLAGLLIAASQGRPGGSQPAATAVDLGAEGFGWTYQARGSTPLASRREITLAMLELPAGTTAVTGLLDAEAQVNHRLLGTARRRRAATVNSAAPFVVPLEHPD
jgi:hypothetical protein